MAQARILLAEDHTLVAKALEGMLAQAGFRVVATTSTWTELPKLCAALRPDLVLTDVHLPPEGSDGVETARQLLADCAAVSVVGISGFTDPFLVERALAAGCAGFVSKTADVDEVATVCAAVLAGESPVLDRRTASLMTKHLRARIDKMGATGLTTREIEVLTLVVQGLTTPQIAAELYLSRSTIAGVLAQLFEKFHVTDRTRLAVEAVRSGLVS